MCRAPGDAHMAFDDMEAWLAKHREQAPAGMQSMFQTDTLVPALGWTWMQVSTYALGATPVTPHPATHTRPPAAHACTRHSAPCILHPTLSMPGTRP